MWEQYESPEEKRATAAEFAPAAAPIRAGGTRSGVGVAVCAVGFIVSAGLAVGLASSAKDAQPPSDRTVTTCERTVNGVPVEIDQAECRRIVDDAGVGLDDN